MRNDQPGILLIVGGDDEPGRVMSAGSTQALLIRVHVILPEFPLVNVRHAEFPVLLRFVDAFEETLSLFVARKMKEYFDGPGSVAIQVALQIHDGAIAPLPDGFVLAQLR